MSAAVHSRRFTRVMVIAALACGGLAVEAAPVASGPPLAGSGDGLNSYWVRSEFVASDIAGALDILAGVGFIESRTLLAPYIDYRDFSVGTEGNFDSPDLPDPFTEPEFDATFAVRFDGYLNITTAGTYTFRVHSDDGFRLTLGGEVVSFFDGNRSPANSDSSPLDLDSGLYAIELIGWEADGQYVDELSWLLPDATEFTGIGTSVLFTAVPVPAALPLLAVALCGLGCYRRRSGG